MALNFPNSPGIGSVYTDSVSGFSYEWNGTLWKSYSPASSSNIRILDDISGSFNGIGRTFAITSNSAAISPPSPQSLIINLGGVVQDPSDDYSVSGSNIIFSDAPTSGLTFSGVSLGPAVPISTILDGTTTQGSLNVVGLLSAANLIVSGLSTFTNGPVLIGSATSTGTASQRLQVTGGGYVSGSVGIGTTNPTERLTVSNNINLGSLVNGGTATPSYIFLGNNYSTTATRDSLKIQLYNDGGSGKYGFSIGSAADVQYHSQSIHDFYLNNSPVVRINPNNNLLIGSTTDSGTASQRLQVTGSAYVSGNLGVGVTNPASRIDAWSTTQGSTALRATSSPSFSTTLFPGVIAGLSTSAASAYSAQFAASGIGVTSGEIGVYSFYPTFANFPADLGPRRAVDLVGGFSTGTWGTEYFSVNVGRNGTSNDSAILTNERFRINGTGNVGIATTNPTQALHVVGNALITGNVTGAAATFTNLTVNGTQTIINTTTLEVLDKNIGIGSTSTPTDTLADGSGITIYGTTNKTLTYNNTKKGFETNIPIATNETRIISGAEKVHRQSGNTVTLTYNSSSSSNVGYTTNPTGDITVNVVGIPTSSDFDDHSITFAVIVNNTGTARTCTAVNLNGVPETIRWAGGSLSAALSGVTTTTGHTIFSFTGINTVGSASTAVNYTVLGTVSGGFW